MLTESATVIESNSGAPTRLTLAAIIAAEPEVEMLLASARGIAYETRHDCHFCRERAWKHGTDSGPALKPWLMDLVGWESRHRGSPLGTSAAYCLVVDEIMRLLPECRRCG